MGIKVKISSIGRRHEDEEQQAEKENTKRHVGSGQWLGM